MTTSLVLNKIYLSGYQQNKQIKTQKTKNIPTLIKKQILQGGKYNYKECYKRIVSQIYSSLYI